MKNRKKFDICTISKVGDRIEVTVMETVLDTTVRNARRKAERRYPNEDNLFVRHHI